MSDFKHEIFDIISHFTGHENVITLNVAFVDFMDDLESGLFLSQLIYWSDRGKRKDGFIFKTDKDWYDELRLSKYAVRKAKKKLVEMGLLETKIKKANGNPTTHYKLNKEAFTEQFVSFLRNRTNESVESENGNDGNTRSLTETTTDINNRGYSKIYLLSEKEGTLFSYYSNAYKTYFNEDHPTMTEEKMKILEAIYENLSWKLDVSEELWRELVDYHFDHLPPRNNGNILSFLTRDGGIIFRYLQAEDGPS